VVLVLQPSLGSRRAADGSVGPGSRGDESSPTGFAGQARSQPQAPEREKE
jgi:hypothetical protein